MPDFDPSPRSAKRPRTGTYRGKRTILGSPAKSSRLSDVLSAFSPIPRMLFGSTQPDSEPAQDRDSAYASKDDSLNEEIVVEMRDAEEAPASVEEIIEKRVEEQKDLGRRGPTRSSQTEATELSDEDNAEASAIKRRRRGRSESSANTTYGAMEQNAGEAEAISSTKRHSRHSPAQPEHPPVQQEGPTSTPRKRKSREQALLEADLGDYWKVPEEDQGFPERTDGVEVDEGTEGPTSRPAVKSTNSANVDSPRRHLRTRTQPIIDGIASPQPKGILTPSRRRRDGPRKSVMFDDDEHDEMQIEIQLGFKDIGQSGTTRKRPQAGAPNSTGILDNDIFFDHAPPPDILASLKQPLSSTVHPHDIHDTSSSLAIKSHILARITTSPNTPPTHLSTQYQTLHALLTSTITAGESNSLLLLGSHGAGKSLLINPALSSLSQQHQDDFHIVRLNGFFQTDDKLALREIWRQLGREMSISESETGEVMSSYADTMASLLSLLSHPDEMDPEAMHDSSAPRTSKSVIIILDEFDLFATHPRQTLLYNLFDIAQSKKAPIAVIGCSTRMDVVECLEKRVKSRFSHRWVHVPAVKSLSGFVEAVEAVLCVGEEEVVDGMEEGEREKWNQYVKNVFLPSSSVRKVLNDTFHTNKSLPAALAALHVSIATLDLTTSPSAASTPPPSSHKTKNTKTKSPSATATTATTPHPLPIISLTTSPPTLLSLLPNLPMLHLALLVAATRLEALYLSPQLNFNSVHHHYLQLITHTRLKAASLTSGSASSVRQWSKEMCRGAWEELAAWALLVPVAGGRGAGRGREDDGAGEGGSRWYRCEVSLEECAWAVKEGDKGEVLRRWCREEVVGW